MITEKTEKTEKNSFVTNVLVHPLCRAFSDVTSVEKVTIKIF